MKKIIYIIGLLCLIVVVMLNVVFTAFLEKSEHVLINFNSLFYIFGLILVGVIVFFITYFINKYLYSKNQNLPNKTISVNYKSLTSSNLPKLRKKLFIIAICIYALFAIVWTIAVRPGIGGDQIHTCNLAQTIYSGNVEQFLPNTTYAGIPLSQYVQGYSQQIPLAFLFSIFFRIIRFDAIGALRALNVIASISVVFALYLIGCQLSQKYKINKVLLLTLILGFISLPMLCTFIYGDIPSLACCLFSVYFMMKYTSSNNIKYAIISSIFAMFGYMFRMNSLIFVIATVMYLLLNLICKEMFKRTWKENLLKASTIILYIVITIVPAFAIKNYYLAKYNLDKTKSYPTISYFLMAMEEGPRANGWYSESIGEPALKNPEGVKDEYSARIKERLEYFSKNIGYTFNFYIDKLASTWTENTYSAIRNNTLENVSFESFISPLTFWQKVLLIITCFCSLVVLIQNRKNISLEVLFLITIFIGGFAFHILWEAKSRYIIPYIVVLIPVSSIAINKFQFKRKTST